MATVPSIVKFDGLLWGRHVARLTKISQYSLKLGVVHGGKNRGISLNSFCIHRCLSEKKSMLYRYSKSLCFLPPAWSRELNNNISFKDSVTRNELLKVVSTARLLLVHFAHWNVFWSWVKAFYLLWTLAIFQKSIHNRLNLKVSQDWAFKSSIGVS
jgi:hypothetical protein